MRIHSAGVMSAALVVGLAGSVAAYRSQVTEDLAVDRPAAAAVSPAPQQVKPRTRVRWAPCPKGSQLEGGVCVTDVVRTVVVPAAPEPAPVPVPAAVSAAAVAATGHEDSDDAEYDDQDEHGEDDQDEHGEDGHDEHDDDEHGDDEHDDGDDDRGDDD